MIDKFSRELMENGQKINYLQESEAGFDLSEIDNGKFTKILRHFGMTQNVMYKTVSSRSSAKGYFWYQEHNKNNYVVTSQNPLKDDYAGYVGISGDDRFVRDFYKMFKRLADFIKDENYKKREFI